MRAFLLAAMVLGGCAPLEWSRPDASPEQARADSEDCQQRAWRESQLRPYGYGAAYRWGRWRDPFWSDRYFDETRLARFCMEVRGYTLQAAPRQ